MNPVYNSHILKWKDVNWPKNQGALLGSIQGCQGNQVIARIRQAGRLVELVNPNGDFVKQLQDNNVDLKVQFDLEIITRQPQHQHLPESVDAGNDAYTDRADLKSLEWNGERGSATLVNSRIRNTPMFFRNNGMNADLVDLYSGGTLFLVLNGGSLAEFDWSKLKAPGICTFGVNNGAHNFRPNFWTCVDDPTRFMRSIWADATITKFVPMAHFEKPIWDTGSDALSKLRVKNFPNVYGYRRNESFKADQWLFEDTINWGNHSSLGGGRSVMIAALRIAYLLGFRRVCLVGCDFHMDESNRYWFAEERSKQAINNNQNSYRILTGFFEQLQPRFLAADFKVVNCSPQSHLKVFPQADLEEELSAATISTADTTSGMYVDRFKPQKQAAVALKASSPRKSKAPVTPEKRPAPVGARAAAPLLRKIPLARPGGADILPKLIASFSAASRYENPFTHLRLESAFSDLSYRSVLQNLPDAHHYHYLQDPDWMRPDGSSSRRTFGFSRAEMEALQADRRAFWSAVRSAFLDRRFEAVVRKTFHGALQRRFGRSLARTEFRPQLDLICDLPGHKIGVHSNMQEKAVTIQFYLPPDFAHGTWGTTYYRRGEAGKYVKAKLMEFLPATGHAFVVTDRSFHGVEIAIPEGKMRNSLILTYYLKDSPVNDKKAC